MPGKPPRSIRKKPCPYCGKLLEAPDKRRFHNHLARHATHCPPYRLEHMRQMLDIIKSMVTVMYPGWQTAPEAAGVRDRMAQLARFLPPPDPRSGMGDLSPEGSFAVPLKLDDTELKRVSEIGELERLLKLEAKCQDS
jgi:hypothetical protein